MNGTPLTPRRRRAAKATVIAAGTLRARTGGGQWSSSRSRPRFHVLSTMRSFCATDGRGGVPSPRSLGHGGFPRRQLSGLGAPEVNSRGGKLNDSRKAASEGRSPRDVAHLG